MKNLEISLKFSKKEHLKSEKRIGQLFRSGSSVMAYPLRAIWLSDGGRKTTSEIVLEKKVQVAFSVPKRVFKTAVDRNRLKRQIREAWRLNKQFFKEKLPPDSPPISMMLIYVAKEKLPFSEIENGVRKLIRKFAPKPEREK